MGFHFHRPWLSSYNQVQTPEVLRVKILKLIIKEKRWNGSKLTASSACLTKYKKRQREDSLFSSNSKSAENLSSSPPPKVQCKPSPQLHSKNSHYSHLIPQNENEAKPYGLRTKVYKTRAKVEPGYTVLYRIQI